MGSKHHVDIDRLDKKITELSDALARLSDADDLRKLILLIRQPGWTTLAEYKFFQSMLDQLNRQLGLVQNIRQDIMDGAELVGKQERELAGH